MSGSKEVENLSYVGIQVSHSGLAAISSLSGFLFVWLLQHDAVDVFDDVEQSVVMKEDIWISGVRAFV